MSRVIYGLTVVLAAGFVHAQAVDELDVVNLIPGLDIEARIGLGQLSSADEPVAITAFIRNNSNETIEGRLVATDRWRGSRIDLGEIYLAPDQVRRFCSIRNFADWGNPELSLISDGRVLWKQPLPWGGYSNRDRRGLHRVGILHDGASDHQFRVELPVTSSTILNQNTSRYGWQDSVNVEFTDAGHQIETGNLKTWQVPDHFGPLEPLTGLVALSSVDPEKLNAAQRTAIAKWVTTGGSFYLPVQSQELLKAIENELPFPLSPASVENTLATRRCGLGRIILYPDALFGDSTRDAEEVIYRSIAAQSGETIRTTAGAELLRRPRSYGRNATRVSLMAYFFGYLVLSVVPIVFVTGKWKRKVLPYTVGLVGIGCLTAAVVGATLRTSTGEARWLTLTVPGENGTVQYADLEVRSTGGISSRVGVSGKQPDLQAESPSPRSYYYGSSSRSGMGFEGFDWRTNEAKTGDRYQLQSQITPWGTRRLRATDFASETSAPDVDIVLKRDRRGNYSSSNIQIQYKGPRPVRNVHLLVQLTQQQPGTANSLSCVTAIPDIETGRTNQHTINLSPTTNRSEIQLGDDLFEFTVPVMTPPNSVRAFLVGRLDESSSLTFENQLSDFELDHGAHLWMYEIPAERIQTEHP